MWVEGESQPSSALPRRRGLGESRLFWPGWPKKATVTEGSMAARAQLWSQTLIYTKQRQHLREVLGKEGERWLRSWPSSGA